MDMKELRKNAEKVIAERFPDFNFSTLDWGELDPFYLEHPEEIPIEHEFIGYRQVQNLSPVEEEYLESIKNIHSTVKKNSKN